MADSKITALTALTAADPANDMIPIVDVSDTPPASGNTKRISINNLLACSPSATLASATITGDLTVDTNVLKVDTTLNRVGIGTASPTSDLDIFRASGSGITSGISLRTAAGAGGDGSFIKWLSGGTNEKVAQIDGVLNGTDVGYLSFLCGNGADAMAEQYRVASSGLFTWFDGAGGTRMTLNSTGLGVGVVPSAGKGALQLSSGINFPATQVASSDVNTLDDYKESTWTPTITAGTGTPTTVTVNAANYTKIGRVVVVNIDFSVVAIGTAAGSLTFTLPFSHSGSSIPCGAFRENVSTGNMGQIYYGSATTASCLLYNNATPWVNGYRIQGTYTYFSA